MAAKKLLNLLYRAPAERLEMKSLYLEDANAGALYVVYPLRDGSAWEMQSKRGWSIPFEKESFDTADQVEHAMRQICPDLRQWKFRRSTGAWWLW